MTYPFHSLIMATLELFAVFTLFIIFSTLDFQFYIFMILSIITILCECICLFIMLSSTCICLFLTEAFKHDYWYFPWAMCISAFMGM